MTYRPWTTLEVQRLREMAGKLSTRLVAARLGRTPGSVTQRARILGLSTKTPALPADFDERLRGLWQKGSSDADIARELDVCLSTAREHRVRLGLASNRWNEKHRAKVRRKNLRQFAHGGNLITLRWAKRSLAITRAGWPAGLNNLDARILDALESGPKTRREICADVGRKYHPIYALRTENKNPLTRLRKLGYVAHAGTRLMGEGPRWERLWELAIERRHVATEAA
jgi:hypothetical protein